MKSTGINPTKTLWYPDHISFVGSAANYRRHEQKGHLSLRLAFIILLFTIPFTTAIPASVRYPLPSPLSISGNPFVASEPFADPFASGISAYTSSTPGIFRTTAYSSQRLINPNPSGLVVISDCRYPGLPTTRSISGNRLIRPPTGLQLSRTPWHLASRCCLAYQAPAGILQVLGQVPCSKHFAPFTATGN